MDCAMEAMWSGLSATARMIFCKLVEAVSCPQRCKDCVQRLVLRHPDAQQPSVETHGLQGGPPLRAPCAREEGRYLLSTAPAAAAASAGSRAAMQDVVETVFSKVFSKKRDDDSSSTGDSGPEPENDTAASGNSHVTRLARAPPAPPRHESDSNESDDSVFDDELSELQIVRSVSVPRDDCESFP